MGPALSGYLSDLGINDNFMKKIGSELKPGGAAVFVLVRKATGDKVLDRLKDFAGTGTVLQTSLSVANRGAGGRFGDPLANALSVRLPPIPVAL